MTNEKQVAKFLNKKLRRAIVQTLHDGTQKIKADAQQLCPVDNGQLRASIEAHVDELNLRGQVFTRLKYAPHVEYMTKPHIIRPKNKEVLRFEVGRKKRLAEGRSDKNIVFAKEVHHPGTSEQPFMRPAADKNRQWLIKRLKQNIQKFS